MGLFSNKYIAYAKHNRLSESVEAVRVDPGYEQDKIAFVGEAPSRVYVLASNGSSDESFRMDLPS